VVCELQKLLGRIRDLEELPSRFVVFDSPRCESRGCVLSCVSGSRRCRLCRTLPDTALLLSLHLSRLSSSREPSCRCGDGRTASSEALEQEVARLTAALAEQTAVSAGLREQALSARAAAHAQQHSPAHAQSPGKAVPGDAQAHIASLQVSLHALEVENKELLARLEERTRDDEIATSQFQDEVRRVFSRLWPCRVSDVGCRWVCRLSVSISASASFSVSMRGRWTCRHRVCPSFAAWGSCCIDTVLVSASSQIQALSDELAAAKMELNSTSSLRDDVESLRRSARASAATAAEQDEEARRAAARVRELELQVSSLQDALSASRHETAAAAAAAAAATATATAAAVQSSASPRQKDVDEPLNELVDELRRVLTASRDATAGAGAGGDGDAEATALAAKLAEMEQVLFATVERLQKERRDKQQLKQRCGTRSTRDC
jgi:hypothetical protein